MPSFCWWTHEKVAGCLLSSQVLKARSVALRWFFFYTPILLVIKLGVGMGVWVRYFGITLSLWPFHLSTSPGFVQMISSEPLNLLQPNLIWYYIITSESVMQIVWLWKSRLGSQWGFSSSNNDCPASSELLNPLQYIQTWYDITWPQARVSCK